MTVNFQKLIEALIRFLGIPRRAFGTITIKLQAGVPKHVTFEESFDLNSLNLSELKLTENEMFTKHGAKNLNDDDSSTILSEVELSKEGSIVKENKLKPQKEEEDSKDSKDGE